MQQQQQQLTLRRLMLLLGLLLTWSSNGESANILLLFPHSSESHFAVMRTLVSELASREEHNVTVYTSHRLDERLERVTEIVVAPEYAFWSNLQKQAAPKGSLLDLSRLPAEKLRKSLASVGAASLDHFLSQAPVQQLLKLSSAEFEFDAIIVDLFYTEALLALGYVHQKPIIGIVSTDFGNYMEAVQDFLVPVACSPIDFEQHVAGLGFLKRLSNIRSCMARRKEFVRDHHGAQEQLLKKHFKSANVPSLAELQASHLSVLLLNNHVPLLTPRPLLQQIVNAGGLHIRGPRELPWNLKRYLEESRSGVIYLQLGNEQLCGQLSKEKLKTLFDFMDARKERIVWTCHDVKTLEGLPKNVFIQHAVPQIDILAHPNVRAFIMNGDLLSLQEGIVRHVPILALPIFANEQRNVKLAVELGVALRLDHDNVTTTALNWAVDELITNQQYQVKIREASTEFRDRPLGALASAMYWVNYVLRHKGGAAIKTRGIGISSCQLHLFDLFVFYSSVATFSVGLLIALYFAAIFIIQRKNNAKKLSKLN